MSGSSKRWVAGAILARLVGTGYSEDPAARGEVEAWRRLGKAQ